MKKIITLCGMGLLVLVTSCATKRSIDLLIEQPVPYRINLPDVYTKYKEVSNHFESQIVFDDMFAEKKAKMIDPLTIGRVKHANIDTFEGYELDRIGTSADLLCDGIYQLMRVYAKATNNKTFELYKKNVFKANAADRLFHPKQTEHLDFEAFLQKIEKYKAEDGNTITQAEKDDNSEVYFFSDEETRNTRINEISTTYNYLTGHTLDLKKAKVFSEKIAADAQILRGELIRDIAQGVVSRYRLVSKTYAQVETTTPTQEKTHIKAELDVLVQELELIKYVIVELDYVQNAALFMQNELSAVQKMKIPTVK